MPIIGRSNYTWSGGTTGGAVFVPAVSLAARTSYSLIGHDCLTHCMRERILCGIHIHNPGERILSVEIPTARLQSSSSLSNFKDKSLSAPTLVRTNGRVFKMSYILLRIKIYKDLI